MPEIDLDAYTNLYIDSIKHREEKADLLIKLGQNEHEAVKFMRERLLQFAATRNNIDVAKFDIALDVRARKLVVTEKPGATPPPPSLPEPPEDNSEGVLESGAGA